MTAALVRRLTPADAAAHRALMLEAYALAPDAFTSSVAEREGLPLSWWAARMADGPGAAELVCGAFAGETLVGAAGLAFEQRERTRHKATLFGMYVRPAARGQGVARRLVEAVLAQARSSPLTELVQLTVTESNAAAVQLYARCGFVPFGSEPCAVKLGDRCVTKLHLWQRIVRAA
ncbi:MAG: GNAT family N-acetyltransferase [Piscinibacter sp.]